MENITELEAPIEIPVDSLSAEAVLGIIDSFISREGTDYGSTEVSHDSKVHDIRRQLRSGQIKIVFEPASESITLVTFDQWKRLS